MEGKGNNYQDELRREREQREVQRELDRLLSQLGRMYWFAYFEKMPGNIANDIRNTVAETQAAGNDPRELIADLQAMVDNFFHQGNEQAA